MQQNLEITQPPTGTKNSYFSSVQILSEEQERLDRLTRLATRLFSVPLSFMLWQDETKLVVRAACNRPLEQELSEAESKICQYLLKSETLEESLIIEDSRSNSWFAKLPQTAKTPELRFYAFHVLKMPDGKRVGALVVADYEPRDFSETDQQTLADHAALYNHELALSKNLTKLYSEKLSRIQALERTIQSVEERSRHSEAIFRRIAHNIQNGAAFIFDRNLRLIMADGATLTARGWTPEMLEGRLVSEIWPDWNEWIGKVYKPTLEGLNVTEEVIFDGRTFLVNTAPIEDDNGLIYAGLIIIQDIEEQERAKRLLNEQSHILEMLAMGVSLPEVLERLTFTIESQIRRQVFCSIYLVTQPEPGAPTVLTGTAGQRLPAAYREAVKIVPIGPNEGCCGTAVYERQSQVIENIANDRRWKKYCQTALDFGLKACWSSPITAKNGEVLGTFAMYYTETTIPTASEKAQVAIATHIAGIAIEKKLAEEKLAAQNEHLSVTLASIADGVISTDIHGNVLLLNQVAQQITGWSQSEALNQPLEKIFVLNDPNTGELRNSRHNIVLETGIALNNSTNIVLVSKLDRRYHITYSVVPMLTENGQVNGAVVTFRDITTQYKIEQEMIRAQKLESIGVLAGGIAHDFNNLLAAILGNVSLTRLDLEEENPVQEYLEAAEKASLRARDLTQQLLTFAKGGNPVKKPTNMAALLKETGDFTLHGSRVRGFYSLPEDLWPVEGDESQLSQVFQNIIINAVQSMSEGGIIHISASNTEITEPETNALKPGAYVAISIADQGVGISPEHLSRIFDPYFTTKPKGHGLGLASAYSIIKNHDGQITVDSRPGKGTIFTIYLPIASGIATNLSKKTTTLSHSNGKKRVLIMDDEPAVRQVAGVMLKKLGYEVTTAAEGTEAVEAFRKALQHEPFDIVLLDLTIPGGMGGEATLRELKKLNPDVKAIASSGYSTDPVMAHYSEYGFEGVLGKPYKLIELDELLQNILNDD